MQKQSTKTKHRTKSSKFRQKGNHRIFCSLLRIRNVLASDWFLAATNRKSVCLVSWTSVIAERARWIGWWAWWTYYWVRTDFLFDLRITNTKSNISDNNKNTQSPHQLTVQLKQSMKLTLYGKQVGWRWLLVLNVVDRTKNTQTANIDRNRKTVVVSIVESFQLILMCCCVHSVRFYIIWLALGTGGWLGV